MPTFLGRVELCFANLISIGCSRMEVRWVRERGTHTRLCGEQNICLMSGGRRKRGLGLTPILDHTERKSDDAGSLEMAVPGKQRRGEAGRRRYSLLEIGFYGGCARTPEKQARGDRKARLNTIRCSVPGSFFIKGLGWTLSRRI